VTETYSLLSLSMAAVGCAGHLSTADYLPQSRRPLVRPHSSFTPCRRIEPPPNIATYRNAHGAVRNGQWAASRVRVSRLESITLPGPPSPCPYIVTSLDRCSMALATCPFAANLGCAALEVGSWRIFPPTLAQVIGSWKSPAIYSLLSGDTGTVFR